LPENEEEEKEEILLTTASVTPALKAKSSPGQRQPNEISSADIRKHLKRQTEQLSKVTTTVQSIQKDSKSTTGQIKLIKQMQSQLKQLQNQLTQIQKFITKKDFAIKTTRLRKKTINPNRSRKKR
jgi:capsule polysaccharide export protein KpsE/RkpR